MDVELENAQLEEVENNEQEFTPNWWQRWILRFIHATGFNAFTASLATLLLMTCMALGSWLVSQHFQHKVEMAALVEQQEKNLATPAVPSEEVTDPEILQLRLTEAQQQLTEIKTQLTSQNADKVLSNQELLGIQNNTLQKEIEEFTRPHLDAPIIDLDPALIRAQVTDPTKPVITPIEVPVSSALFTVLIHKPADKIYPAYLVELFAEKKAKPLWSGEKKQSEQPKISLSILRRNYPSGKYRIALSGLNGKKKEPIDSFNLDVKFLLPPKAKKKK